MKAIRVREFGQVLVKVHAIGVNPVDTYIRSGNYANKPALPYTPGTDAAGVIEAVGEEVTNFRAGDRVYIGGSVTGVYAEKAVCRLDHVHPLPPNATFQQGAAIHVPYSTAYRGLFDRIRAKAGQTVLIHGATGGVGIAATQLAVAAGLKVIGTGGTEAGRKLVAEQGAAHVLDHKAPGYLDHLMKITDGRGVDIVLEMLANVNLAKDLTVLAKRGVIVVIGNRGSVEINPRELMRTEGSIVGLLGAKPEELTCAHAAIGAALRLGTIKPVIGKEVSLAEAPAAHKAVMESSAFGKIVLIP
jgi:NADPH2:quinone reductase